MEYSDWFYTMLPYLTFTEGFEGIIYDSQLFSKGLLLESQIAHSKGNGMSQYDWRDIQDRLCADEVAIEFIKVFNCYCAAIVEKRSEHPRIVPLFTQNEYDSVVDGYNIYNTALGYNLVFAPLQLPNDISTIYFSPSGILNSVAIENFIDTAGVRVSDRWNIMRLSSTKQIIVKSRQQGMDKIALFGGLDYGMTLDQLVAQSRLTGVRNAQPMRYKSDGVLRYGVEPLMWSLPEVQEIAGIYRQKHPSDTVRLITGCDGVEERVRLEAKGHPKILHFSTHGYYWNDEMREAHEYVSFVKRAQTEPQNRAELAMLYSGLFLSGANIGLSGDSIPDEVDDGILTAAELSMMDLSHTDMIVLSACKTGLGETNGEGIFGLQRGFKLAGANTLLMSLWNVDDEATKILMVEFYRNLLNGISKTESLKYAQEHLRNTPGFSTPKYWAPWILLDAIE